MQTTEFTIAQEIEHEPAFNCWVKHVLNKRDRIIASIRKWQTRYLKKNHMFDIELPKVEEAYALDAKNDNILWANAIFKKVEVVRVAFKVLSDGTSVPIGHQFVQCHMEFNIKMDDFRQKARLVTGGHITKAQATTMYASIVLRETVRIDLMIAALNDLEIKLGYILNVYIQAPVTEKVWTQLIMPKEMQ